MLSPLVRKRNALVQHLVHDEIASFIAAHTDGATPKRHCAYCNRLFTPRQRWHFFCPAGTCRKAFYAGQFRPRD